MDTTSLVILIIALALSVIYLGGRLIEKNRQLKRTEKEKNAFEVKFNLLKEILASDISMWTIERINFADLDEFSDKIASSYFNKFFRSAAGVHELGKYILRLRENISNKGKIERIMEILLKAKAMTTVELLAVAVIDMMIKEDHGSIPFCQAAKIAQDFILDTMESNSISPFIKDLENRIFLAKNELEPEKAKVLQAKSVLIIDRLERRYKTLQH